MTSLRRLCNLFLRLVNDSEGSLNKIDSTGTVTSPIKLALGTSFMHLSAFYFASIGPFRVLSSQDVSEKQPSSSPPNKVDFNVPTTLQPS